LNDVLREKMKKTNRLMKKPDWKIEIENKTKKIKR